MHLSPISQGVFPAFMFLRLPYPALPQLALSYQEPRMYGFTGGAVVYSLRANTTGVLSGQWSPGLQPSEADSHKLHSTRKNDFCDMDTYSCACFSLSLPGHFAMA